MIPLRRTGHCSLLWVTAPSTGVGTKVVSRTDVVINDEASAAPTLVIIKKAIAAARQHLNIARCPWKLSYAVIAQFLIERCRTYDQVSTGSETTRSVRQVTLLLLVIRYDWEGTRQSACRMVPRSANAEIRREARLSLEAAPSAAAIRRSPQRVDEHRSCSSVRPPRAVQAALDERGKRHYQRQTGKQEERTPPGHRQVPPGAKWIFSFRIRDE